MFERIYDFVRLAQARQRMSIALSRGSLAQSLRNIDPCDPKSWEFSAFSQNGEDGITDYLCSNIEKPNRYFIEIGSADGIENNSAFLAIVRKYSGLMIEGDPQSSRLSQLCMPYLNLGVESINTFVTVANIVDVLKCALYTDADFFSIDIDGNDYYLAKKIFSSGFRPAVISVEYNSTFGSERSITIRYADDFDYTRAHPSQLYYGVSIQGWKNFFTALGYQFVTVDQNGVNAFFVDPRRFALGFLEVIKGYSYKENFYELRKFKLTNESRFELLADKEFEYV